MTEVVSKLQHKEFETGEFIDEKVIAFSECQKIIEEFPWDKERENLKVGLTNPSITFQKGESNYLKLSTSYNQKFVLNYFNESQELYSKTYNSYFDALPLIEQYFNKSTFDSTELRKENTWLKNIRQHFETQNFIYEVTFTSARKYLIKTSLINFCLTIGLILLPIFIKNRHLEYYDFLVFGLISFLVGGGLNIILFLNHYSFAKGKLLILSRGNDNFYFGESIDLTHYNKNEILNYTTIRHHSNRSPINEFAVLRIEMKNGEIIRIPSIYLDHYSWERKLYNCVKVEKNRFPFLRK